MYCKKKKMCLDSQQSLESHANPLDQSFQGVPVVREALSSLLDPLHQQNPDEDSNVLV